jgi:hypothetical protein
VTVDRQRRIPVGPLIGLVGALLLLVSLFLNWWDGVTAFTAFEVLDLVLAALALAAIVSLTEAAGARLPSGMALGAALALPLGLLALLIVLSQLVNDPPAIVGDGRGHDVGIWLALAGALLITAGSLLSVARVSLALDLERRERGAPRDGSEPEPEATGPDAPTVAEPRADRAAARPRGPERGDPQRGDPERGDSELGDPERPI